MKETITVILSMLATAIFIYSGYWVRNNWLSDIIERPYISEGEIYFVAYLLVAIIVILRFMIYSGLSHYINKQKENTKWIKS
jgi:hypothetical protein